MVVNTVQKYPLHFIGKHPLFRKKETETGVYWENNIFYLWWEFLRRSDAYRKICENKGRGKLSTLYKDFGDVFKTDFKSWWTDKNRGEKLFAEPRTLISVQEVGIETIDDLRELLDPSNILLIAVPRNFKRRAMLSGIRKILAKNRTRKPGQRRIQESRALYPLAREFNVGSLKTILRCYDLKRDNPKMPQWRIAQLAGVANSLTNEELVLAERGTADHTIRDKKASMNAAVSRNLRFAKLLIMNVEKGRFPDHTK